MRFSVPRVFRTLVFIFCFVVIFIYSNDEAFKKEEIIDPVKSYVGDFPVFAGSPFVIYRGSVKNSVELQGFAEVSDYVNFTFKWEKNDDNQHNTLRLESAGSKAILTGFSSGLGGDYYFDLIGTNSKGEEGRHSTYIRVMEEANEITAKERKFLKPKSKQNIALVLPIDYVRVKTSSVKSCPDGVEWRKKSGSPIEGWCQHERSTGYCHGLVEGAYGFYFICHRKEHTTISLINIVVYPAKLRIYDHYSNFTTNQGLRHQYIKDEPVLPICQKDPHYKVPLLDEALLLDHVQSRAQNKNLIIGFTGASYASLASNWVCSLTKLGLTNYLIVAFDQVTEENMKNFLYEVEGADDKTVYYDSYLLKGRKMKFTPGSSQAQQAWKEIMSVKTSVIASVVNNGYNVFVMDADTTVLRNPFPFVEPRTGDCDIQWQADGKYRFSYNELTWRPHLNAGVYYAMSNERTKSLYKKWLNGYKCLKGRREQHALILALHNFYRGKWTLLDPIHDPKTVPEDVTRFCYLEPEFFPDGGYFVHNEDYQKAFGKTEKGHQSILHANNMKQDDARKVTSFKAENAWFLDKKLQACDFTNSI